MGAWESLYSVSATRMLGWRVEARLSVARSAGFLQEDNNLRSYATCRSLLLESGEQRLLMLVLGLALARSHCAL
jgi:hypothetical protein